MPIKKFTAFIKKTISDARKVLTTREGIKSLYGVSLYRNAFYLLVTNLAIPVSGFFFWIIVARIYSSEEVGIASALLSAISLIYLFSSLGLSAGLVRFLPQAGDRSNLMINTVFTITGLASFFVSCIFIAGLGVWSPKLLFLQHDYAYLFVFAAFAICNALETISDWPFIANRRSNFALAKGLTFGLLRLPMVVALAAVFSALGFGIFASCGLSSAAALALGILFLPRVQTGYRPVLAFDKGVLKQIFGYSLVNQLSVLLWYIPTSILPLIVINILGTEANAYFYIAWSVGSVLAAVPMAFSSSLFAEGSNAEQNILPNTMRAIKLTFLILIPAVILVEVLANKLLLFFGGSYSQHGTTLVRILALSSFPLAINYIYMSMLQVQMRLRTLLFLSSSIAVVTLAGSYVLIHMMGINGAGLAWLGAQVIVASIVIVDFLLVKSFLKRKV